MNPHETLPAPEMDGTHEAAGSIEFVNEQNASKRVEQTPAVAAGAGALSGVAVDGAQTQLQQVLPADDPAVAFQPAYDPAAPSNADDVDLIEKEWVLRAKAIVAATLGDPHAQNVQINRMKADYIKKRYNKDIKFKEE